MLLKIKYAALKKKKRYPAMFSVSLFKGTEWLYIDPVTSEYYGKVYGFDVMCALAAPIYPTPYGQ